MLAQSKPKPPAPARSACAMSRKRPASHLEPARSASLSRSAGQMWRRRCQDADDERRDLPAGLVHPVPPRPVRVPLRTEELRDALQHEGLAWTILSWPFPGEVEMEVTMPACLGHSAVYKVRAVVTSSLVRVRATLPQGEHSVGTEPAAAGGRAQRLRRTGASCSLGEESR